jgi:hypothetical protein
MNKEEKQEKKKKPNQKRALWASAQDMVMDLDWLNDAIGMIKGDKEIGFDYY